MDSPEAAQEHMNITFHKNMEMISSVNAFREESIASYILYKKNKDSDWLDHLKKEFLVIFEEPDKDSKFFDFFLSKIVDGMENQDLSLFDNIALKNEIFTFILAQNKKFKCNYCMSEPFESVADLKGHFKRVAKKNKKKIDGAKRQCQMTPTQQYLFGV